MGGHGLHHPQADRPVRVGRQQQLRERRYRRRGRLHRQGPARHACLGHRRRYPPQVAFFAPGATTIWGGYTQDQDGLGGFTRTTVSSSVSGTASSYSVWDGEVSAGAFPGIPFKTEITCSETTKWYLAVDQAIDSAAMNLFIGLPAHRSGDQAGDAGSVPSRRPASSRTFRSRSTISTCSSWVAVSSFSHGLAASIPRLRPSAIGRPQLSRMEVGMDVPPRDLICRPLAALKDNRAEAEERAAELCHGRYQRRYERRSRCPATSPVST